MRNLQIPIILFLLVTFIIGTIGCWGEKAGTVFTITTHTPFEPYPQSHLRLIGIYNDKDCTEPISFFDFGSVAYGYSRGISIPIYIKNMTEAALSVYADDNDSVEVGYITLDAAPPKFYSERDIEPGAVENFILLLDIIGTPSPGNYACQVTITAQYNDGGDFQIIFPAQYSIYK